MMKKEGFTLIEVMVVIVILGIIATLVATNIGGKVDPAKVKLTQAQIVQLKSDVELFKVDHHRFPESLQDLVRRPAYVEAKDWHGYRDEVPLDAWQRPYLYRTPGARGRFDIFSWGEDGKEGSDDDLWSHPPK